MHCYRINNDSFDPIQFHIYKDKNEAIYLKWY